MFDSNNGFRSQKFKLGNFSIKKLSVDCKNVAVLTNDNAVRVYFGGNYSMGLTCPNLASDPISDILCVQTKSSSQVTTHTIY